jgi:hypothetical protein
VNYEQLVQMAMGMMTDHPGRLRDAEEAWFKHHGLSDTLIGSLLEAITRAPRRDCEHAVRDALRRRLQRNGGAK